MKNNHEPHLLQGHDLLSGEDEYRHSGRSMLGHHHDRSSIAEIC